MSELTIIDFKKLVDDQEITKDDIDFITHQLFLYAEQEKELFSFAEDMKKIINNKYYTYLIRKGDENILLLLFDIRTAASGNDFLYVHLLTGKVGSDLQEAVYFIDKFLTDFSKHFQLGFVLFDGRIGWDKFFSQIDVRKKYTTYVKEIH